MWVMILFVLLVFVLIGAVLIGLGVGIGYVLRALIPGLEIDLAIVAGAVFAVGLLDLFGRYLRLLSEVRRDSEEQETLVDEPLVAVPRSWFRPESSGRKKKRKQGPRAG